MFRKKLEQFRYRRGGDLDERTRLLQEEDVDDPGVPGAQDNAQNITAPSTSNNLRPTVQRKKKRKRSADTISANSKSNESTGFIKRKCMRPLKNLIKKKGRSPIWAFFTKLSRQEAKCDLCIKVVQSSGGTTNLFEHLYRNHTEEYLLTMRRMNSTFSVPPREQVEMAPEQPIPNSSMVTRNPVIEENNPATTSRQEVESNESEISSGLSMRAKFVNYFKRKEPCYDRNDPRRKRLDKFLAVMIARDFQPLDIVNDEGFKQFCFEMDPRYTLPCRTTLTTQIMPELYSNIFSFMELYLKSASSVSITTDTWTSKTNQHYIGVTAHFIDINFNLQSTILTVRAMNGYSSDDFKDEIENIMTEFGISDKTSYITTDNASVMVATSDKLKLKHIGCYAHTLNLVVMDCIGFHEKEKPRQSAENAVNELDEKRKLQMAEEERKRLHDNDMKRSLKKIIEKAKAIVTFFHKSGPAAHLLKTDPRNPKGLHVIQSVITRWNSLYAMLKRVLELEDSITTVLNKFDNPPPALSRNELNILKNVVEILEPLEVATRKISASNYVTISKIIPLNSWIKIKLDKVAKKLTIDESKWFCNELQESIKVRLDIYETRTGPRLATLLDPTIPRRAWGDERNYISAEQQLSNALQHELKMADEKKRNIMAAKLDLAKTSVNENSETECDNDMMGYLKELKDAEIREIAPQKNNYLAEATLILKEYYEAAKQVDVESSPLDFWKNYDKSESLKLLAIKYLSISGSSVPSERLFSTSGYIITDRRTRLLPENVDLLTFINKNYVLIEL